MGYYIKYKLEIVDTESTLVTFSYQSLINKTSNTCYNE